VKRHCLCGWASESQGYNQKSYQAIYITSVISWSAGETHSEDHKSTYKCPIHCNEYCHRNNGSPIAFQAYIILLLKTLLTISFQAIACHHSFHPQKQWNAHAVTRSKKWQQTSSEDHVHRMLQLNPRRPFGNNSVTRITPHSYRHDNTIGPVIIMPFWRPADCIQGKGKPLLCSQHATGQEIWQKITGAFQNLKG